MFPGLASRALNSIWFAAQWPAHRRFGAALRNPERAQKEILRRLLASNQDCAYGRKHGFHRLGANS